MSSSTDIFINNLNKLISLLDWSNRRLSKESGVSDRLIGMYRNKESSPSIDKAEKLAKALGYELWQMQMPDFDPESLADGTFERLYHTFVTSDEDGRRVLESTAEYINRAQEGAHNDPNGGNGNGNGNEKSKSAG